MARGTIRSLRLGLATMACCSALAAAQAPEASWRPLASVTPIYRGDAKLHDGGSFTARGASLRVGLAGPIGTGTRAGVTLAYDRTDFDFDNPVAFGGRAPWNVVERTGISVPLAFALRDGWGLGIAPSIDRYRETGADIGKSRTVGAVVSAVKRYSDGDQLGFGLGVFEGLERTRVFPFVRVDLALSERWRLVNPLPAGPTGPAGLELDYRFDSEWRLGVGAAWRVTRFRLSADGPTPNGIGEERGVPLFLRATRDFAAGLSLSLYAGTITGGRLRVEDEQGNTVRDETFGRAPLFGATLSTRFR